MKWFLAVLVLLIVLVVSGAPGSVVNGWLRERAAADRREFCGHLAIGDVAGAVRPIPANRSLIPVLTNPGKIASCRDDGPPVLAQSAVPGSCPPRRQNLRVAWESGAAVEVAFTYSCIPALNLEYSDLERVEAAPAKR